MTLAETIAAIDLPAHVYVWLTPAEYFPLIREIADAEPDAFPAPSFAICRKDTRIAWLRVWR